MQTEKLGLSEVWARQLVHEMAEQLDTQDVGIGWDWRPGERSSLGAVCLLSCGAAYDAARFEFRSVGQQPIRTTQRWPGPQLELSMPGAKSSC